MAVAELPVTDDVRPDDAWPYRFEIVPLGELMVDKTYQRPLTNFWRKVRNQFKPSMVGTLIVSERKNGVKALIDGQTRWKAMGEIGLPGAPCLIYIGLTKKEEARLFADLQTQRRGMRTYDRFRAELIAGDERAVAISGVAEELGFKLSAEEERFTLRAIAALESLHKVSDVLLEDVLDVIAQAWGTEDKDAVSADILRGLGHFLRFQERIDRDRLVDRLGRVPANVLRLRATQLREGSGGGSSPKYMSQAILGQYRTKA